MRSINFWNGNKTRARQSFESELLRACIKATEKQYGAAKIHVDNTNYPLANDEANIFNAGADILVTVAGNLKFKDKQKIMLARPLSRGLLGFRLILVRDESLVSFKNLKDATDLQALSIGVPDTWADAEIFRHNNYKVVEKGSVADLFSLLKEGAFDYTALGVNEIEAVFNQYATPQGGISIEPSVMLYYPFPLVFYINHHKPVLAERVTAGLSAIMESGEYENIFSKYHGDVVQRLNLQRRRIFRLSNPILPREMADFTPTLLDSA